MHWMYDVTGAHVSDDDKFSVYWTCYIVRFV